MHSTSTIYFSIDEFSQNQIDELVEISCKQLDEEVEFDLTCDYEKYVPATHWQPEAGGDITNVTVKYKNKDVTHIIEFDEDMFDKVCEALRCSEN